MRPLKILAPAILGCTLAMGGLTPAANATPSASDCLFIVTAAGNGYQTHYGPSTSAPVAGTMYAGQEYDILANTEDNNNGYTWVPDPTAYPSGPSSNTVWFPYINQSTGAYLMTKEPGTCSRLDM